MVLPGSSTLPPRVLRFTASTPPRPFTDTPARGISTRRPGPFTSTLALRTFTRPNSKRSSTPGTHWPGVEGGPLPWSSERCSSG